MTKTKLSEVLDEVIVTSTAERNRIIEGRARGNLSHASLEAAKVVISANKNIVSACITEKSLVGDK